MKSKLLLVLAASFLLVGCNQNNEVSSKEGSEENSSETSKQSSETISESEESEEITSSEDSTSEESSSSSESQPDSEDKNTKTLSVTFLNNNIFRTGKLKDISNDFISAFNGETDLLQTIQASADTVQISNNTSDVCSINTTLQFGSRNNAGELTLNFKYAVTKVSLVAQAYWTSYEYSGSGGVQYSVDENANIYVGDNYIDLTCSAGAEPEKVTKEYSFNSVKTLSLKNAMNKDSLPSKQGQRSYIHSMTITYLA